MGEISGEMRESSVEMLLGDDDWVVRRESGIEYGYNLTQCMFSAGNVNERRRMGEVFRRRPATGFGVPRGVVRTHLRRALEGGF